MNSSQTKPYDTSGDQKQDVRQIPLQDPLAAAPTRNRLNRTHLRGGFCEPDPLDPDRVPCNAKIEHEDRQGISHFFGRNKRATSTIPTSCYPLLCRNHYQERKYRMKETPGIEAGQQCDAIAITMMRMSELTWTDKKGNIWPRWSAFELQMCHAPPGEGDGEASGDEDDTPAPPPKKKKKATVQFSADAKTQADDDAKPARRLQRNKTAPAPVPEWLKRICSAENAKQAGKFNHIGDRGGARYNFADMARIVRHIKSYCIKNKCRLPAVEALPVTPALQAEVDIKIGKLVLEEKTKALNRAKNALFEAQEKDWDTRNPQNLVMMKQVELNVANSKLKSAQDMLAWSKQTLPERRVPKKRAEKRDSTTPGEQDEATDADDTKVVLEGDDVDEETPPPKQRDRPKRTVDQSKPAAADGSRRDVRISDPMETDFEEDDTPRLRNRGGVNTLAKSFSSAKPLTPSGQPREATSISNESARTPSPQSMHKRMLINKKQQPPTNTSPTPAKPSQVPTVSPRVVTATARFIPKFPSYQQAPLHPPNQQMPLYPLFPGFNPYARPPPPYMVRHTATTTEDDSEDDVVVTAVVAKPPEKRKRPPPKLAPGVAVESDTDGETDGGD